MKFIEYWWSNGWILIIFFFIMANVVAFIIPNGEGIWFTFFLFNGLNLFYLIGMYILWKQRFRK